MLDHDHPPRIATDTHTCARAPWLIQLCEIYELYILNGIHSPAAYTCHTSRGESTVDYILCSKASQQVYHTPLQACKITDHDLLYVKLPLSTAGALPTTCPTTAENRPEDNAQAHDSISFRWVEGECLKDYGTSAVRWK
jgi:hypothetical protein